MDLCDIEKGDQHSVTNTRVLLERTVVLYLGVFVIGKNTPPLKISRVN